MKQIRIDLDNIEEKKMEKDWKTFRRIIPEVSERYLKNINADYKSILEASGKTETEKFWDLHEKIQKEGARVYECLGDLRRSTMLIHILKMVNHGMLAKDELNLFSEELAGKIREVT